VARGAPTPSKHVDRSDSGRANAWRYRESSLWPMLSGALAVKHQRQPLRNPDVSLYLSECDSGASVRRARGVHCGCVGIGARPPERCSGERPTSSRRRSRSGRDRNGGKRRPAPGNARTRRSGLWPASKNPVNAEAISTEPARRAILIAHPCSVHAVGSDIGVNLAVWAGVRPFLRR